VPRARERSFSDRPADGGGGKGRGGNAGGNERVESDKVCPPGTGVGVALSARPWWGKPRARTTATRVAFGRAGRPRVGGRKVKRVGREQQGGEQQV